MRPYQLFSDSSCDLPEKLLQEHQIKLIPFYVSFDQETYYKENLDITNEVFYQTLTAKKVYARTSLPSVQDYISMFKEALNEGHDIICLCLTQKFSGSYQAALNAKHILEEQYHDSTISVIDSIQATGGQGLLLLQLAAMKEAGFTIEEVGQKIDILKATGRIMFTLNTLEYLSKGRRIGKVVSLAKDMLDLKPLIQLKDAELIPYSNIRGRKKSLDRVFEMVTEFFNDTGDSPSDYEFCIANATTIEDAGYLERKLEKFLGRKLKYPVFQIGITIGSYTGPGAIGICLVKRYDRI
ncbi:MAG: DegV family protein [Clostridiales bacterium]|jgi:DegV family protein with EDD domain|nr:DegV family protein [Bacillota bacterium]NLK02886.1 DegV family protein [Clostridiales bacterium]